MQTQLEKKSWFLVLLLSMITMGVYIPFWYKGNKEAIDAMQTTKKVSSGALVAMFVIAIINVPLGVRFTVNETLYAIDIGYLRDIIQYTLLAVMIFLSFQVRAALMEKFNTKFNPVWLVLFGPLYLQSKINRILESMAIMNSQTTIPQPPAPPSA